MIKMNLKKFLKPDWRKIVIFLILFMSSSFIIYFDTKFYFIGFPLAFYYKHPSYGRSPSWIEGFSLNYLLLDLILWYLLSCLIVWIYDKVKKKR